MKRPSQKQRILDRLLMGDRLTQEDCDRMHPKIKRLAARIYEIEEDFLLGRKGLEIARKLVSTPGGAKVKQYWIVFPAGGQASLFGNPSQGRPE